MLYYITQQGRKSTGLGAVRLRRWNIDHPTRTKTHPLDESFVLSLDLLRKRQGRRDESFLPRPITTLD